MMLNYPKEWFERSAEIEGNAEIGAGCPAVACSLSFDPSDPALLEAADRLEKIEQQLRITLDGHPNSDLWGETGLIAATMRCVAATNRAAEWRELNDAGLRLRCGELTSQEIRAIRAVLAAILDPTNVKSAATDASEKTL